MKKKSFILIVLLSLALGSCAPQKTVVFPDDYNIREMVVAVDYLPTDFRKLDLFFLERSGYEPIQAEANLICEEFAPDFNSESGIYTIPFECYYAVEIFPQGFKYNTWTGEIFYLENNEWVRVLDPYQIKLIIDLNFEPDRFDWSPVEGYLNFIEDEERSSKKEIILKLDQIVWKEE